MKKKPTMQDVAAIAGVSTATVSNVINNTKNVSEGTKRKILDVIESLDYIPNNLAKSLKMQDTKLIGLLISDIANPFFPPVVRGIEDSLAENGYNLILCETNSDSNLERENLRVLLSRRIEGLMVSLAGSEESHFENIDTPLVFFNRVPVSDQYNKVQVKNFKAAYVGTTHLIGHDYKRVAILAGPQHLNVGRDRLFGYKEALLESGREVDSNYISIREFTVAEGYQGMKELMDRSPKPDAVFTSNNALTLGAFQYLKDAGYRIPTDIAFLGYDDTQWATIVDPPISVVRYPMYEMGQAIGAMIIALVKSRGQEPPRTIAFEPELVVRKSCGC